MTALIRTIMQLAVARLLTAPFGGTLHTLLDVAGLTETQVVDVATVVALGLIVGASKLAARSERLAKAVRVWNLILSWGRSATDPSYVPRHVA